MRFRAATPTDLPRILDLLREFASFEKAPGPDAAAAARLAADFGRRFEAWIAETDGGEVIAAATAFETYGTFLARPMLYLEDLYVTPSARGTGVARGLMQCIAKEAVRRGLRKARLGDPFLECASACVLREARRTGDGPRDVRPGAGRARTHGGPSYLKAR